MNPKPETRNTSLSGQLMRLLLSTLVPVCLIIVSILVFFITYNSQYNNAFENIAGASQFNQNFKDNVDLKMYYYVIDSSYAEGLPIAEVETAYNLAFTLAAQTKSAEGAKAIASVLSLCDNLKVSLYEIEETADYDSRMSLLESNVYILTEMIQDYMYTYLYHEAGHLAQLQETLDERLQWELTLVLVVTGILVFLAFRQALYLCRDITKPINGLCRRVEQIGQGDFSPTPPVPANDPDLQVLSADFEQMVSKIDRLMVENQQEQQRLRAMELALLQAQINPHFLYNTLDTIIWLIEAGKNDEAVHMVTSLSTFFRSSLSRGKDIITLQEEQQQVRSYLEIQQVRYQDILHYELDMDDSIDHCDIPKLTLQPLVENALYHGIKLKRGLGTITVRTKDMDPWLLLEVRDTGAGMTEERLEQVRRSLETDQSVGFGLCTVYRRLQLLYGGHCKVHLESVPGEGTTISIYIPKQLPQGGNHETI